MDHSKKEAIIYVFQKPLKYGEDKGWKYFLPNKKWKNLSGYVEIYLSFFFKTLWFFKIEKHSASIYVNITCKVEV